MPLFDFLCEYCNTEYETVFSKSTSKAICPICKKEDRQIKQFSVPRTIRVPQDDYPRDDNDLINYRGNGKYNNGYKRGMYD